MANQNGINTPSPVGQSGSQLYAASSGTTDAYIVALSPVPLAYTTGMPINFKATLANFDAVTINVNGLGDKSIVKAHDQPLVLGDIEAGQIVSIIYDGTNFQMQSQTAQGAVTNIIGTANQVNVTAPGVSQTVSLSSTLVAPGTVTLNADPLTALQAATKQYVDAVAALGLEFKASVVCATTTALTVTYANGAAGVGATLTNAGVQAAFSTDGITPTVGSRILVKNQASTFQNGIYVLTNAGSGATNWVMTRATDFDTAVEIQPGSFVAIDTGTTLAVTSFLQMATVVTVGTDPITFAQFTYGTTFPSLSVTGNINNAALTANTIVTANGSKNLASLAPTNSAVVVTTNAGVPAMSSTLTNGQLLIGSTGATPIAGNLTSLTTALTVANGAGAIAVNQNIINQVAGRLTFTSNGPTTDASGATTIYYTPYKGTDICLYAGVAGIWQYFQITQLSAAIPAAANQMYDVFVFSNVGVPEIQLIAWTNDTTRATALVYQDGVLCQSGALGKRYMGSFRTNASNQGNDTPQLRNLWNYYNRVQKYLYNSTVTQWTYQSATIRQSNAAATSQVNFVQGVAEDSFMMTACNTINQSTGSVYSMGFGLDSTTTFSQNATYSQQNTVGANVWGAISTSLLCPAQLGHHFISLNEQSTAAVLTTVNNTTATLIGAFLC